MVGYKSLSVYQRAYRMAIKVHEIIRQFPRVERYELGSQLWRAALSIALNIAEGYGRKDSRNEFQHFLRNALGSCNEVRVLYEALEAEYEVISKQLYRLREQYKN